jgi:Holliday junction DNA helicase RuvB
VVEVDHRLARLVVGGHRGIEAHQRPADALLVATVRRVAEEDRARIRVRSQRGPDGGFWLARPAEEMLYLAMEDFRVDVVIGKGPGATAIPLDIAPFTLVGATTRAGLLPAPLRDRFGFTAHLDFYQPDELEVIIRRSAGLLGVTLTDEGAAELSTRSRGTPRIANRLLRRVRDYAEVRADGVVTREIARTALEIYEVDEHGLDRLDRGVLDALVRRFGGGPVGLSTLAVALGEEAETVEVVAEPFLVRCGLLARTPRGRVATAAGWAHLGLEPPPSLSELPTLFD